MIIRKIKREIFEKYKYKNFVIHGRRNIKNDKNKSLNSYWIGNDGCKDPIPLCVFRDQNVFDIHKNKKEQNERKKYIHNCEKEENVYNQIKSFICSIKNKICYSVMETAHNN